MFEALGAVAGFDDVTVVYDGIEQRGGYNGVAGTPFFSAARTGRSDGHIQFPVRSVQPKTRQALRSTIEFAADAACQFADSERLA